VNYISEWIDNDYIYLKENKEFTVKELYKEVLSIIKDKYKSNEYIDILDIGTASGELPYYLNRELGLHNKPYAFDISSKLIKNAKDRFGDDINFFEDDVKSFSLDKKFDVIIMKGVISIFEEYKSILDRCFNHLKENGLLIIISVFNDYNITVKLKFKTKRINKWQSGYNLFPINDIKSYVEKNGFKFKSKEHIMPFDIDKTDDFIRAWTVNVDGKRMLLNGLGMLYNLKVIEVER